MAENALSLDGAIDRIEARLARIEDKVDGTATGLARVDVGLATITGKIAGMEPQLSDFQRLKNRGWGVAVGLGIAGGATWTAIAKAWNAIAG